ncbi:amino acid adenylation domain-containing protein/non-ribosomal peptide synthase protein (TIGR01720 family)/FkbM family methyltransferase [Streptomyces sp. V3I8]|uniref:non-ribosomal peptide synthetase n=1 Tax=Streptomyces sp. V3I8 TaxID=3042279 RepID=UPI00278A8656|nr:non-ribosomal peptide synthetase [Streptomyces sp. V3I8]MDQ1039021.1 amino acid adenylation domain-containing protein/non-ribosomal peptide synthase protein (TIGR01720 family)/FkbM family methyltransferase [Streptomyces sp. V3I8]
MKNLQGSSAAESSVGATLALATFPELFEARVREAPGAPAVESADRSWTYEELNARANRIAHWLIGRGIGPERVVAVAMPRSAEQIAVLLGIMKAGAAYLPWDLSYPSERLAFMATDSAPAAVLTTRLASARLPDVLDTDVVAVDAPSTLAAWDEAPQSDPLDAERIAPLSTAHTAYVIYTSGSTGRPKGVTVTHSGLAALRAEAVRLGDLGVGTDARVLQFASLSFDMSVWDLVSGLTTGAVLVVPEQERLVGEDLADLLAAKGVTHATLPPSVLATLPPGTSGSLERLRVLVIGGEACTPGLVTEWGPGRRFINAYGPTEATVWATFSGSLSEGAVPIGAAMTDTRVHLLDEHLAPVADGQAGELYLAGPSLARGYLGRRALTAARFVADPFGPKGSRMYRTGDVARRDAEGQLVYLGRSDGQVKVRGQRIETGEVEAVLATHPRVRQAVVVAHDGGTGRGKQLVGYVVPVSEEEPSRSGRGGGAGHLALELGLGAAELRAFLVKRLPNGMVPGVMMVIDEVPLTPNGKADKAALPRPEFRGAHYRAPGSDTEKMLAAIFAEVLSVSQVGVDDDFFTLGGDSIQSLQIASGARARGLAVSSRQIFEFRTVSALAEAVTAYRAGPGTALAELDGGGAGWLPHLPATRFLRARGPGSTRSAQAMVLELPEGMDRTGLVVTLRAVIDHHDALRARVVETDGGGLLVGAPGSTNVDALIRRVARDGRPWDAGTTGEGAESWDGLLRSEIDLATSRLDPAAGVTAQFVWFDTGTARRGRLLVLLHQFVVDAGSWHILLSDLASAWRQIRDGRTPELAPVGTSVRRWAHALVDEAHRPGRVAELDLWRSVVEGPDPDLGARRLDPVVDVDVDSTLAETRVRLPAEVTETLLTALPSAFHCGADDAMLAALAMAVTRWRAGRGVHASSSLISRESRRAEEAVPGADLSRTVGPLTCVTPVRLDMDGVDLEDAFAGGPAAGTLVKAVKEQLRALPDHGIGYGLLRHLNPETAAVLERLGTGQVFFRFTDRTDAAVLPAEAHGFGLLPAPAVRGRGEQAAPAAVVIDASVTRTAEGPVLEALFTAPEGLLPATGVRELADLWRQALEGLARHTAEPGAGGLSPSDVSLVTVTQDDIDDWRERYPGLSDIWPVPPLPLGMLVHSLMEREAGAELDTYQVQYTLRLSGPVDPARLRTAAQALLDRHPVLRTAYASGPDGDLVQLVIDDVALPWQFLDLSGLAETMRDSTYQQFLAGDLKMHFDPAAPPMLRMSLITLSADRHDLVLTAHHANVDGWCLPLLVRDLLQLYAARGDASALPPARSYREYLVWLAEQDPQESARVWAAELAGIEGPTLIAPETGPGADSADVGWVGVPLRVEAARELPHRAAEAGVTLNTLVQSAWAVVLNRLSGRQDVVLAAAVSGRPATLPGAEAVVGTFVNTVPVRVPYAPDGTFAQMMTDLQDRQGALLGHHHYGLVGIQRAAGLPTLTDSLIGFESFPLDREAIAEASEAAGIAVTGIDLFTLSHFPVTVFVYPDGDHLRLNLQYQQHLFGREQAEEMAALYGRVLKEIAANPQVRLHDVARGHVIEQAPSAADLERDTTAAADEGAGAAPEGLGPVPHHDLRAADTVPAAGETQELDPAQFFRARLGDVSEPTVMFGIQHVHGDGHRSLRRTLDPELGERVRAVAADLDVGPAVLFHAAWSLVVSACSGRNDVVFGTVVSGLSGPRDNERAVGNILPVRVDLAGAGVRDLLRTTDRTLRDLVRHRRTPSAVAHGHSAVPSGTPLYNAVLDYRDPEFVDRVHDTAAHPVAMAVGDLRHSFELDARTDRSQDPGLVIGCLETAMTRLVDVLTDESAEQFPALELSVLSDALCREVLTEWNRTPSAAPVARTVHEWFQETAAAAPEAVAVEFEDRRLSYGELNVRANRLARHLRGLGVGPGVLVALCLSRSEHLVVAVLAVLKAGGAYVPVDPASPADRVGHILIDSAPRLLVTDGALPDGLAVPSVPVVDVRADADRWAALAEDDVTGTEVGPSDLAYVIYTSGSTGVPKGVMVEHHHVVRLFTSTDDQFRFDERDVWTLFHSFAFDFSVWEIWGALLHGGRLVVVPQAITRNPQDFYRLLCTSGVTVLNQTPTAFRQLVAVQAEDAEPHAVRVVVFGGEALDVASLKPWLRRPVNKNTQLVNGYGITETTVFVTFHPLTEADVDRPVSPIGQRIADLCTYVLDRHGRPVPVGVVGELYIGGAGVTRGYLNRPELTAERFLEDPFREESGARMYRSGDLVRLLPGGSLEYLGRNDDQVKIRGFRIELGEIEARLAEHPGIQDARVLVRAYEGEQDRRLVAYLVPAADRAPVVRELLRLERTDPEAFDRTFELPNGLTVFQRNRSETEFRYDEIFTQLRYLRNGLTIDDGDTVVDAGAGIGLFTLFAGTRSPGARIYAFEPIPPVLDPLRRNVALHGLNAKVFDCGLAAEAGEETFTFSRHRTAISSSVTTAEGGPVDEPVDARPDSEEFTCRLRTLSEIIAEESIDRIDLLRIGVKHAGYEVLRGVRPRDWAMIRQLVIELHDVNGQLEKVMTLLKTLGYDIVCERSNRSVGDTVLHDVYARRADDRSGRPLPGLTDTVSRQRWAGRAALLTDVRESLRTVLPEYMLPTAHVLLEELPLTLNGKLDQKALPEPVSKGRAHAAPRTVQERQLCDLIAEVLRVDRVGMDDNFFGLGGDSLLATRLTSRIGKTLGVNVLIRAVYEARDIAELAHTVKNAPAAHQPRLRRMNRSAEQ